MKTGSKILLGIFLIIVLVSVSFYSLNTYNKNINEEKIKTKEVLSKNYIESVQPNINSLQPVFKQIKRVEVYKGMTLNELGSKLNKSLNSTLKNKGEVIAKYAIQYNVDPYLSTAIILHETGCKWDCSYLVKACNNVGGIKGNGSCSGTGYQAFSSLDEGIKLFMKNLYSNYYAYGLNTPAKLKAKYSGNSKNWDVNVNKYIAEIKAK